MFGIEKPKNMCKYLEKHYGGKWKYKPYYGWKCDDGRYGTYVHSCYHDDDCNCPVQFYIYGSGNPECVGIFKVDKK